MRASVAQAFPRRLSAAWDVEELPRGLERSRRTARASIRLLSGFCCPREARPSQVATVAPRRRASPPAQGLAAPEGHVRPNGKEDRAALAPERPESDISNALRETR